MKQNDTEYLMKNFVTIRETKADENTILRLNRKDELIMKIKYYELECGVKAKEDEEYGCEICRGLVDTEYSIAIKADHYPTFEEAEEFIKEDLKKFGYDGVYGITPLTEQELYSFFDTENIDEWKVLTR